MSLLRLTTQTLAVSLLLISTGCRDREIVTYRTPKEGPTPVAQKTPIHHTDSLPDGHPPIGNTSTNTGGVAPDGSMMGALPSGALTATNALAWIAPAHWQEKAPGTVRKGSYVINGDGGTVGDLGITAFPGDTGGLHANINRWRGQIGLSNIGNKEVEAGIEHIDVNSLHIDFVDMVGPNGIRLLGAIVPHGTETWFFKLTGPDALIARERAAFREFILTIRVR